jgi:hypothetical protein
VLQKTIDLGKLLSLEGGTWGEELLLRGSDEDNNVIVVHTNDYGVFMVELESMRFKRIAESGYMLAFYPGRGLPAPHSCDHRCARFINYHRTVQAIFLPRLFSG